MNIYAMNTIFYQKLTKYVYESLKTGLKNVDIFSLDLLLIPIHLINHWCYGAVDLKKWRIHIIMTVR